MDIPLIQCFGSGTYTFAAIATLVLFAGLGGGFFRYSCNHLINVYLCWRYPIRSTAGKESIPSCQYEWPNGQGDVAKFLAGEQSRASWESKNGLIYRIWNGMTPEVVLTRPEHLRAVFKDSHQHIKAINNNTGWLLGELLGKCVGLISQGAWRELRSVTEGPFVHGAAVANASTIEELTTRHFKDLKAEGKLQSGFHPIDDLRLLPFWIVADIIYGPLSPELKSSLVEIIPLREKLFFRAISGGWIRFKWTQHLPTKTKRELTAFKTSWAAFNEDAHRNAKASPSSTKPPIVSMMAEVERGAVTEEALYHTLDEMLFANLDVMIGGLSWNLLFLAAEPSQQALVRAEISESRKGTEADWSKYLQSSSTLLAACIYESARLKPLAAFSVPQAAPTDRTVEGFVIPAKTNFVIDTHAINIKNDWWGADAEKYRPQRFLERGVTQSRYHYWRFGFGPRQCLGKHVADLLIRSVLVELVENTRLEFADKAKGEETWERKPETWITQPNIRIVCKDLR